MHDGRMAMVRPTCISAEISRLEIRAFGLRVLLEKRLGAWVS